MKKETHIKKKLEELEHQLIKTNTNQREETDKNNLQTQLDNINENKINGIYQEIKQCLQKIMRNTPNRLQVLKNDIMRRKSIHIFNRNSKGSHIWKTFYQKKNNIMKTTPQTNFEMPITKQRENENIVYEGILSEYECKLIQTK